MSTEPADAIAAAATPFIEQKKEDQARNKEEIKRRQSQSWNWQDALYLLVLTGLVIAMALRYTPDLSGEAAGMWWDPLLNMWTLSWDTTTLLHAPTHLWQAQLLYPNNLSLTFSENLLGEALFFAPVFLTTHNPVLAYNITFYLIFLLCGTNMYIMARHYTGKRLAAFVAALIYAFAPYRLGQIDHIHVIAGEWMPLAFLYLDLSLQQGRWRHWILFALFYLLQLLSSVYYGIFLGYALLTFVLIRYARPFVVQLRARKRAYIIYLMMRGMRPAIVLGTMLLIIGILLAPYLASLHSGFARSLGESTGYAAFVRDFGFASPYNWLYGISYYHGVVLPYDGEHYLFLGFITMALAGLGVVVAFRKKHSPVQHYIWTALIVLLFAFGPVLQYSTASGGPFVAAASRFLGQVALPPNLPNIPMPWMLAYFVLPGFAGLRVPARLTGVLLVMLALLAAHATAWLQNKKSERRPQTQEGGGHLAATNTPSRLFAASAFRGIAPRCLLVVIPFALLLEAVPAYLPVTHIPTGNAIPAVYTWLATHGGQQAIVELPMFYGDTDFVVKQEAWYDYYAIYHSHPIADGWSGERPALTSNLAILLSQFPSERSLALLKKSHISFVVLHLQLYTPTMAAALLRQVKISPHLLRAAVFGSDSVWQVI